MAILLPLTEMLHNLCAVLCCCMTTALCCAVLCCAVLPCLAFGLAEKALFKSADDVSGENPVRTDILKQYDRLVACRYNTACLSNLCSKLMIFIDVNQGKMQRCESMMHG